jgi:hypothetical protein
MLFLYDLLFLESFFLLRLCFLYYYYYYYHYIIIIVIIIKAECIMVCYQKVRKKKWIPFQIRSYFMKVVVIASLFLSLS